MKNALVCLILGCSFALAVPGLSRGAAAQEPVPVALGDSIGTTIDAREQEAYHLFPRIQDFRSGQIVRISDSEYRLDYVFGDASGEHNASETISAEAFELMKLHVSLVEKYFANQRAPMLGGSAEAQPLYSLALSSAAVGQYDRAMELIRQLIQKYPRSLQASEAEKDYLSISRLRNAAKPVVPIVYVDSGGRTELLIFSGYYGLWLGLATPAAAEADSPAPYGLGLLIGPAASIFLTHELTKDAVIGRGRAFMIAFGAHFGTWQGVGWSVYANDTDNGGDDRNVIAYGEAAGLVGLAAAAVLTSAVHYSAGQAELVSSSMMWGAWFGIVAATFTEGKDIRYLSTSLLGSDIASLGTMIAAPAFNISPTRVRFIDLGGFLGTCAGLGVNLLATNDNGEAFIAILGVGTAVGMTAAAVLTRNMDSRSDFSRSRAGTGLCDRSPSGRSDPWSFRPELVLRTDERNIVRPYVGVHVDF